MINRVEFIQKKLIDEIEDLQKHGFLEVSLGLMSQYIETLGAFLDNKPFKTPAQSKKRFDLALEKLFPPEYKNLNKNDFLYKQLRSNFSHLGINSQFLVYDLKNESPEKHLKYSNRKTTINPLSFYKDYKEACLNVIELISTNKLKDKKLA